MAKIVRYDGEVKAFGIDATTTERTVFGSPSASPVTSDTLNDNLNADFMRGWGILAPGAKPPKQYFNGALFTATQFIAYLHQMGIPEWNGAQEYHIGSASIFSGKVYFCKTNTHKSITDPSTDTVNWSKGLDVTDIVNNLTSTDTTKALGADQGKVLSDNIQSVISTYLTSVDSLKKSMPYLKKTGIILPTDTVSSGLEDALFTWTDGEVYTLSETGKVLKIYRLSDGALISSYGTGLGLASTLVVGNTLYVLATTDWTVSGNTLKLYKTTDLINFTFVQNVTTAPTGDTYFNSTITANPNVANEFTIGLEQRRSGDSAFTAIFFRSTTGIEGAYSKLGGTTVFGTGVAYLAACPCLVCTSTGDYYCAFLQQNGAGNPVYAGLGLRDGEYFTRFYKMNTFNGDWTQSKNPLLVASGNEGVNNSDLSITEYDGILLMSYSTGDQLTWGNHKLAVFNGTIDQLVSAYYK